MITHQFWIVTIAADVEAVRMRYPVVTNQWNTIARTVVDITNDAKARLVIEVGVAVVMVNEDAELEVAVAVNDQKRQRMRKSVRVDVVGHHQTWKMAN